MKKFDSRKYLLTMELIFLKAVNEICPEYDVVFKNSLNNGVYITLKNDHKIRKDEIEKIEIRMKEIIEKKIRIKKTYFDSEQVEKKHLKNLRKDLKELFMNTGIISFFIYELDGYKAYFIEDLYLNTKDVNEFEIYKYDEGIILKTPREIDGKVVMLPKIDDKKIAEVYKESSKWNELMDVSFVGGLNKINLSGKIGELIKINESLHSKKIAEIADKIVKKKKVKIVTIAGPSSSGKTTFSNRLRLQLLAAEQKPIMISLDDYYKNRDVIPLDSDGEKDFEVIEALDIELLNENLKDLMKGKEVELPLYNFITGKRNEVGRKIKLPENGVLILEGIHGLNKNLIAGIDEESLFRIYVSCLPQLNIDANNRIKTSIVRKMRRIVRDSISRDFNAEETLKMWDKVRRGESKNIFPYQENADVIFNTSLSYEIGVLKPYVERELIKVKIDSPYYREARKLLKLLSYFVTIKEKHIPEESLLKEFIGGSCFYEY